MNTMWPAHTTEYPLTWFRVIWILTVTMRTLPLGKRQELDARGQNRRDEVSGTSEGRREVTLNQFTQAVRREPFRPFNLVLVDGRAFTVDHPEFVAIDRRGREVTFYADDNTQHFIDAGLIAELVLSTSEKPAEVPAPEHE
jgi:hypothetical protein